MAPNTKIQPVRSTYRIFIASSLFLLSLAIFSLIWNQKQKEATEWISHTYKVKLNIEKCFGLVLEAESSQRGFLLSHDSSYLSNIAHAESLLKTSLVQLDSLVSDNNNQLINFSNFKTLISARISRLHIVLDSLQKLNSTPAHISTSPGKMIMDSIHKEVRVMQAVEDNLLGRRNFIKDTQGKRVIIIILLFSIIAFAILMWSFFRIRKESSLRQRAQLDANVLENLVGERTLEIKKINNLLKDQNEILERKNLELIRFTNIASHDLKEPLRKIQMFTNLIDQSPGQLTGKTQEYFSKINQQSNRMQVLIESVLRYAQTDDNQFGFQMTNLNDVVAFALDSLSEKIKEKSATIRIQELPTIFANPNQMEQLFINLIDNGLKYSQKEISPILEINISTINEPGDLNNAPGYSRKIDFCDNGIGFDETYSKKIFEIFQRLHSREEYTGTGIGLAICKKIVENHRGTITAKSVLGSGSVFSVTLPAEKPKH